MSRRKNERDDGLRQKLLKYLLSNNELNDKKLSYILNNPFKTILGAKKKSLSAHNSDIWCSTVDAFQTSALEHYDDTKLLNLVKLFGLSGSLL